MTTKEKWIYASGFACILIGFLAYMITNNRWPLLLFIPGLLLCFNVALSYGTKRDE